MHIAVSSASYEPVRQAVAVATTSVLSAPARGGHVKNEPFQPGKKRCQTSQKLAQTKKPPSVLSLLGLRLPEEGSRVGRWAPREKSDAPGDVGCTEFETPRDQLGHCTSRILPQTSEGCQKIVGGVYPVGTGLHQRQADPPATITSDIRGNVDRGQDSLHGEEEHLSEVQRVARAIQTDLVINAITQRRESEEREGEHAVNWAEYDADLRERAMLSRHKQSGGVAVVIDKLERHIVAESEWHRQISAPWRRRHDMGSHARNDDPVPQARPRASSIPFGDEAISNLISNLAAQWGPTPQELPWAKREATASASCEPQQEAQAEHKSAAEAAPAAVSAVPDDDDTRRLSDELTRMMARFQLSDAEQELVRGLGVHCVADMAFLSQELTDMSALGLPPVSALKLGKLLSHLAPASAATRARAAAAADGRRDVGGSGRSCVRELLAERRKQETAAESRRQLKEQVLSITVQPCFSVSIFQHPLHAHVQARARTYVVAVVMRLCMCRWRLGRRRGPPCGSSCYSARLTPCRPAARPL